MIDLHLHLDGSLTAQQVIDLAKIAGVTLPSTDEKEIEKLLTVEPDCRNLGQYLEKFDLPLKVLQRRDTIEKSVYGLLKRLAEQGICYAEIRFAPQLHTSLGLSQDEVVNAAVTGLRKGIEEFKMPANLILCCMRGDDNHAENLETVAVAEKYLRQGVCAIDLAGNEAAYPTEGFADVFALARERNIPFIIHAGEAAGAQSVSWAVSFGASRIGHGIHALEDAFLMEQLRTKRIFLELCYTSNIQTKAVEDPARYPLDTFLKHGIAVTVNTDNMTVSGTTLKAEYRLLQRQFGLPAEAMKEIALCALDGAFLPDEKKAQIAEDVDRQFTQWLEQDPA